MKTQTLVSGVIQIHLLNIKEELAVLNVDDVALWCSREEFEQWQEITSEKRKREFAAVRYLLFVNDLRGLLYYEDEVPKLKNGVCVSVSHSHDWVGVALCETHRIGMDLELVQDKVARVYEKFIHDDERELYPKTDLNQITLLWSFKETIFKLMRQPGLLFSEDICVSKSPDGTYVAQISAEQGKFEVPLAHHFLDEYVLTFNSGDVQKQA
jgi:4'-phosphopantetheinyl transferase